MIEHKQVEPHTLRGHGKSDSMASYLERPASRYQLGKNFSYPRPDGNAIRHEPSNSRSSVNSNGSLPGMTDSSDSDGSGDDDYHYNTSASQIFDSFWPTSTEKTTPKQKVSSTNAHQPQSSDTFNRGYYTTTCAEEPETNSVAITQVKQDGLETRPIQWPLPKSSCPQPESKLVRNPVSYSVYPKPTPLPTRITLPPRTSSLNVEANANARPLKESKSNGNISSRASIPSLYLTPPVITTTVIIHDQPRPAPKPPVNPPQRLRQATSAYNIRESLHFNATAPLVPVPPIPDQLRSAPPQIERFVSVFEFDSETEDDVEHSTFAKRIARGLSHKKSLKELGAKKEAHKGHRKSASEKSALSPKKSDSALDGTLAVSRKRGGSLGRMLLFKNKQ